MSKSFRNAVMRAIKVLNVAERTTRALADKARAKGKARAGKLDQLADDIAAANHEIAVARTADKTAK